MAVLCGMPIIQYSTRNARLSLHKLFSSAFDEAYYHMTENSWW